MKITKSELARLVEQAMQAHPRGDLGKDMADAEFPVLVGYEGKSEIAYNQDELDSLLNYLTRDNNIPYSLDSLADVEVKDLPAGVRIEMMESVKISKSRIRSIIQESVRTVAEQVVGYEAPKGGGEESDESGKDWVQTGALSGAPDDDTSLQTRIATSARQTSQQRQQDLDKGDAVAADEDAEELQGLVDKQTEGKVVVSESSLRTMIRQRLMNTLLREQTEPDSVLVDYVKEEIVNSNDPEPGKIEKEELISRSEGAGYKKSDVEEVVDVLLADGDVEESDGMLTLTQ